MWRSLLSRAAIYHATRTRLSVLCDLLQHPGVVQGAFNDLELQVSECAHDDVDDATMVSRVVEAWDRKLTEKLQLTQVDADTKGLLAELQVLVRCASGDDPLHTIFEGVASQAAALYGAAWRSPNLRVLHIGKHPRDSSPVMDPYAVTARTPSQPKGSDAAVELLIFCSAFGPAAYAAVPMLLIHECVCHVAAGQDEVSNDSAFAEGLLDWAAYLFLDMWAGRIDRELSGAARTHALQLRSVLTRRTDTSEGRARQLGHRAAETLKSWFEDEYGHESHTAAVLVARLAVQLNQVESKLLQKDCFVSSLEAPLPPHVEDGLRAWAERRVDAATLLATSVLQ